MSTYPDLRTKNRMVSLEASWVKEWFFSGFPNLVVRSLAMVGREVFQRGAAVADLVWGASDMSPNCAVTSVGLS